MKQIHYPSIITKMLLYESKDFLLLNKASNLSSQGDTNAQQNLYNLLQKPFIVHRLDKNTTGLIFYAKNQKTAKKISLLFQEQLIKKTYFAIGQGLPIKNQFSKQDNFSGTIKMKQKYDQKLKKNISTFFSDDTFLEAQTDFQILGFFKYSDKRFFGYQQDEIFNNSILQKQFKQKQKDSWFTIYKLQIQGGRKHQIRSHLEMGLRTPVILDSKYGYIQDYPFIQDIQDNHRNYQFQRMTQNQIFNQNNIISINEIENENYQYEQVQLKNIMGLHAGMYTLPGNLFNQKEQIQINAQFPLWIEYILNQAFQKEANKIIQKFFS